VFGRPQAQHPQSITFMIVTCGFSAVVANVERLKPRCQKERERFDRGRVAVSGPVSR
jgi:hypothetical protein